MRICVSRIRLVQESVGQGAVARVVSKTKHFVGRNVCQLDRLEWNIVGDIIVPSKTRYYASGAALEYLDLERARACECDCGIVAKLDTQLKCVCIAILSCIDRCNIQLPLGYRLCYRNEICECAWSD